jgi:hypothetical protein
MEMVSQVMSFEPKMPGRALHSLRSVGGAREAFHRPYLGGALRCQALARAFCGQNRDD